MLRCALLATALVAPFAATAQVARPFPADALRAELQVLTAPEVLIAGKAARLAPGARIRGENNLLLMPGELAGARLLVHYTQEGDGLVRDVWVLNAAAHLTDCAVAGIGTAGTAACRSSTRRPSSGR